MDFKTSQIYDEFRLAPTLLRLIAFDFEKMAMKFGKKTVITNVLFNVRGSSGVHGLGRAIDVRDEFNKERLFTDSEKNALVEYINARYPRRDGYKTCMWHNFNNGPYHFHIQIAHESNKHGL